MNYDPNSKPNSRRRPRAARGGTIHASAAIAETFAALYLRLASGTAAQRQAAGDFKQMVLTMGGDAA